MDDCDGAERCSPSGHDAQSELARLQLCDDEVDCRRNLIVNYIPPSMKDDEIRALFGNYGEIETCKLIRDKLTGQCLGYGFVKFVNGKDAERALMALNGLRLQNKVIKVSVARPSSPAIKAANLYVSGLPKHFTVDDLHQLFAYSGKIVTSRILYDNQTGISKGVAFVRFDQRSDAERAVAEMNGRVIDGHKEPLVVKFANTPTTYLDRAKKSTLSGLVGSGTNQSAQQLPLLASSLQSLLPLRNIAALQTAVGIPNLPSVPLVPPANQQLLFQPPLLLQQMVGMQQPFNVLNMPLGGALNGSFTTGALGNLANNLTMNNGALPASHSAASINVVQNASATASAPTVVGSAGGPIHSHAQHGRLRYSPLEGCTIPVPTLSTTLNSSNVVVSTSGSQQAAGAAKHGSRPTVSNAQQTQPTTVINGSSVYAGHHIDSLGQSVGTINGQPIGMLNGQLNRAFGPEGKMVAAPMPADLLTLIGCGVNYSPF